MQRRTTLLALGAACLALVAACGSPTSGGGGAPAAGTGGASQAEQVYSEVGGLTGDARRDRLVELAKQEGNTLSLYTSLNADIADAVVPAFKEQYGIDVKIYRADSETVLQRTLQESSASFAGADVVETNATEMAVLADKGLTGDYRSAERDKINPQFQYQGWTPTRFNIFAPAWNTQQVTGDLIPKTLAGPGRPEVQRAAVARGRRLRLVHDAVRLPAEAGQVGRGDRPVLLRRGATAPRSPRATRARSSCCPPVSSASSAPPTAT